jgi:hypothetical protein
MTDDVASFENAFCLHETARAIRVRLDDGREFWIPKSVVHEDSEVYGNGHQGELVVARWFAEKEGIG